MHYIGLELEQLAELGRIQCQRSFVTFACPTGKFAVLPERPSHTKAASNEQDAAYHPSVHTRFVPEAAFSFVGKGVKAIKNQTQAKNVA